MECEDLFHRVIGEQKSGGIEDFAVITQVFWQQSCVTVHDFHRS